jgi:hypothetical protein
MKIKTLFYKGFYAYPKEKVQRLVKRFKKGDYYAKN